MKQSVVLFSAGLDSTTALHWATSRYEKTHALTFDYGQRSRLEICLAEKVAERLKIPHTVLKIDLGQVGGSSLTDKKIPIPAYTNLRHKKDGPPSTYVPFRNGIFLALAAAWAEVKGIREIICGFNVIDSPDYPDTRAAFVSAMEQAINQGTRAYYTKEKTRIITPFINLKKSEIIREGLALGADYSYSTSCYSGIEIPCGKCASCVLRQKAWDEVGLEDHLIARLRKEGKQ